MVADDEEILTDLCVVGAGPAGITIACELDKRGLRVCLLRRVEGISSDVSSGRAVVRATATRSTGCMDPGFGPSVALLASEARGLGNEHDLVGRYFAERLSYHAGHVVLSDETSLDQLDCFHRPGGAEIAGALRVTDKLQRERHLLNVVFFLVPRLAAFTSNAARSLTTLRKAFDRRPLIACRRQLNTDHGAATEN